MTAKAFMVLGTGSEVGKSVIAAGLCRIFSDWGFKVAPFKAQNMSNNSFVTEDGGEIGRAQAVQAECARIKPTVDMNPVLLKPSEDNLSQVVVRGKSLGNFHAREYFSQKEKIWGAVCESYQRLACEYEIVVIEGAGSCAEVNLKENDFVNFKTAEMADAACVLVGDINRGGIFASLLGTLDLLTPHERERIVGFIVNKFRGDRSLFEDGVKILEERSGKKVWGVIPHDPKLWIESEDSVCLENEGSSWLDPSEDLNLGVILLPRISNFTDFEILAREPGVQVRYLKNPSELGSTDLLILPGTKATLADLDYLRKSGWAEKILSHFKAGGRILGICGGWQMLGRKILDPSGAESSQREKVGLGLFEMETEFFEEKILRQSKTPVSLELFGQKIEGVLEGYEIHMGRTVFLQSYPSFGEGGAVHPSGCVAGTYFHGLFDSADFRKSFLSALRMSSRKKNLSSAANVSARALKEESYQQLANLLRENLDESRIKNWIKRQGLRQTQSLDEETGVARGSYFPEGRGFR